MRTKKAPVVPATALDAMLMGLMAEAPRSGYELRKLLAGSPLKHFSESPGAVYPALRRLEGNGWVVEASADAASGRGRRDLALTARGRAAFAAWLARPVTRTDVVWRLEELSLRFAFLHPALPKGAALRFLEDFVKETAAYLSELRAFHKANAPAMSLTGRLAFESGLALYEGKNRWARRALRELRRSAR
jgi:DNA-binding PadR family transcriptional regulator